MSRRSILSFILLAALVVSLPAPKALADSSCGVTVSYHGVDNVQLSYALACSGQTPPFDLMVSVNGGGWTTLVGGVSVGGTYRHAGLAHGTYVAYSLFKSGSQVGDSAGADLNGSLAGMLLYDEAVDGATLTATSDVTVPDAKHFTMTNTKVQAFFSLTTTGTGTAHLYQGSAFGANTVFANKSSTTDPSAIKVEDSTFTNLGFARGAVTFNNNEFRFGVTLWNRSASLFSGNVFEDGIYLDCDYNGQDQRICDWSGGSSTAPSIAGNSFTGPHAIYSNTFFIPSIVPPIQLGQNYYGSYEGASLVANPNPARKAFLVQRGAIIQDTTLVVRDNIPYDSIGKFPAHLKVSSKSVFLHSWIAGQNSLSHSVDPNGNDQNNPVGIMGRPTLLSLSVGTTFESLSHVRIHVSITNANHPELDTSLEKLGVTLSHAHQDCTGVNADKCTINLILPAVPPTGNPSENFYFAAYADLSGVANIEPGMGDVLLGTGNIQLYAPPARKFRVDVVPIDMGGFCSGRGDASDTYNILRDYVPSEFPLRPQDMEVTLRAPHSYYCITPLAVSATLVAEGVLNELAASDMLFKTNPPDLVVAVVPYKAVQSWFSNQNFEGMSLPYERHIILVSDAQQNAVLHEMGHQAGLWVSPEQYDKYPDAGLHVENTTAFDPEGHRVLEMAAGTVHFPPPAMQAGNPMIFTTSCRTRTGASGLWPKPGRRFFTIITNC